MAGERLVHPNRGGRDDQQSAAGWQQHLAKAVRERIECALRPPGVLPQIVCRPGIKRWIEQHQVEALSPYRLKQIAATDLDAVLQPIEQGVDPGASYRFGRDIHRHDTGAAASGRQGAGARPRAHVEHPHAGMQRDGVELMDQRLAGVEERRIEDVGQDENRHAVYLLEHEAAVAMPLKETELADQPQAPERAHSRHHVPFFLLRVAVAYYLAMARRHALRPSIRYLNLPATGGVSSAVRRRSALGYRGLLLLAFLLPFDLEQRPLLWTPNLSITNLTILRLAVTVLAMITVGGLAVDAFRGVRGAAEYFYGRRLPLVLLLAFLLSSAISTILATKSAQGGTWFLGVLAGALLWLALPLWLADDTAARVHTVGVAIVAGAIVTGIVGIVEVLIGPAFDRHLAAFKLGPTLIGPFLRLSATFSSANVAAMYVELALPFALAGFISALSRASRRRPMVALWLAAVDVLLVALLLTYSRGALLGLLAAACAMALAGRGMWRAAGRARLLPILLMAGNLALVILILASTSSTLELLRFSTENDRTWYQAAYRGTVPAVMSAGRQTTIPVIVENRSPLPWNRSGSHRYGLSYHWLRRSWKVVRFANTITWLSSDLPPGGRQTVAAKVTPPSVPGRYVLLWDMVWDGTTWFGPRSGHYQASPVRVIPAKTEHGVAIRSVRAPPPDIANLPTAPALSREYIWSVAIAMIEHRPLFGFGPQGFRENYDSFSPPDPAAATRKPPPHAHNLALEMLVDWGVVGGGLFAALLAVLWWPLLARVARGRVDATWQLAPIGAAAALLCHQTVDYFLTKQAIVIMLWLLAGLAAAMTVRLESYSPAAATPGSRTGAASSRDTRPDFIKVNVTRAPTRRAAIDMASDGFIADR